MHIEERDVPDYVEPVRPSDLVIGNIYFSLVFIDDDRLIPALDPVVFIGWNLEAGDVGQVYFQDARSYREGVVYNDEREDAYANFDTGSGETIQHIFECEKALDELIRCSVRRAKALRKEST